MHPNGYGHDAPVLADAMQEFSATVGTALEDTSNIAGKEVVIEALRTVFDPEIPVNLYDLGLIYTIDIKDDGNVFIEMSLTAPGCPVAGEMPGMVSEAASGVEGIGIVETKLVWEPSWSPDLMSEDAKLALGMY